VNNTLEYIRTELKPDMVVWTGDNSPHDHQIGDQAIYEAAYCINVTAQMMQLAFAD
jgi:hypothetical protein